METTKLEMYVLVDRNTGKVEDDNDFRPIIFRSVNDARRYANDRFIYEWPQYTAIVQLLGQEVSL